MPTCTAVEHKSLRSRSRRVNGEEVPIVRSTISPALQGLRVIEIGQDDPIPLEPRSPIPISFRRESEHGFENRTSSPRRGGKKGGTAILAPKTHAGEARPLQFVPFILGAVGPEPSPAAEQGPAKAREAFQGRRSRA